MANEIKTDLVYHAKGRGFAKVRDEQGRLNEAISQGHKGQKQGFDSARKSATSFEKSMDKVMQSMSGDRAAQRELGKIGKHFDSLAKKIQNVESALKKANQASGAFTQGLFQGLGAGEFLQRGPGMGRQMAGRAVGRVATGGARAMFTGAQGLVGAMQGIPIVGGMLSAPLQQSLAFSQQAMAMQRQRMGAAPILGATSALTARRRVPGIIPQQEIERRAQGFAMSAMQRMPAEFRGDVMSEQPGMMFNEAGQLVGREGMIEPGEGTGAMFTFTPGQGVRANRRSTPMRGAAVAGERRRLQSANARRRRQAARRAVTRELGQFEQVGRQFGMSPQESLQFTSQLADTAGGRPSMDQTRQAMAANRLGFGQDISGAFVKAQRRGGIVAGGGGMLDAIGGGQRMGLEQPEIRSLLQSIAAGINSFEQTGIPINPRSIGRIGASVAGQGLGGIRGLNISRQLARGGQRIGATGPTGAVDVLALQTMGGMKGTSAEGVLQAMERMEEGQFTSGGLQNFTKTIAQQGRGLGEFQRGRLVRQAFQSLGIQVGARESRLMATQALGGQLSPEQRSIVQGEQAKILAGTKRSEAFGATPGGIEGLARTLVDTVSPNIKKQSELAAKQLVVGEKMVTNMQKLEGTTTAMTAAFTNTIAPLMESLTSSMEKVALATEEFVKIAKKKGIGAAISTNLSP